MMQKTVNKQLKRQYESRQYRLHVHFHKFASKEEAMTHVPSDMKESEWIDLCNYFVSDAFKVSVFYISIIFYCLVGLLNYCIVNSFTFTESQQ